MNKMYNTHKRNPKSDNNIQTDMIDIMKFYKLLQDTHYGFLNFQTVQCEG